MTVDVVAVVMTEGPWRLTWDAEAGLWRLWEPVTGTDRQVLDAAVAAEGLPFAELTEVAIDYPPGALNQPPAAEKIGTDLLTRFGQVQAAAAAALVGKRFGVTVEESG